MNTICKDALRIISTFVPQEFCILPISKFFTEIAETLPNKFGICLFCGSIKDTKELLYFTTQFYGEDRDCYTCPSNPSSPCDPRRNYKVN